MGIFSNISSARGSEGGVYLLPGTYTVEVQRCKQNKTRKGVPFFVVELKVIASDTPDRKPNTDVSWMVTLDKDASLGNIADFMRVALAALALQKHEQIVKPQDVPLDEKTADEICAEDNPLVGVRLSVQAFNVKTKENKDFTRVKWKVPELAA